MRLFNRQKGPGYYFSEKEQKEIVQAIAAAETATSGEIRLYVEGHCQYDDALDRAREVFQELKMYETAASNGVLIYLAMNDRKLAVFGDEGIHQKVGADFWQQNLRETTVHFQQKAYGTVLSVLIHSIGEALKEAFPYDRVGDINELPDDIVYGE